MRRFTIVLLVSLFTLLFMSHLVIADTLLEDVKHLEDRIKNFEVLYDHFDKRLTDYELNRKKFISTSEKLKDLTSDFNEYLVYLQKPKTQDMITDGTLHFEALQDAKRRLFLAETALIIARNVVVGMVPKIEDALGSVCRDSVSNAMNADKNKKYRHTIQMTSLAFSLADRNLTVSEEGLKGALTALQKILENNLDLDSVINKMSKRSEDADKLRRLYKNRYYDL